MTWSIFSRSRRSALASTPISSSRRSTSATSGRSACPKTSGSQEAASWRTGHTMVRWASTTTSRVCRIEAITPTTRIQEAERAAEAATAALG
jgi:hypothetical protein